MRVFYSLGFVAGSETGGEIVLGFDEPVCGSITVFEQSPASGYPLEQAEVWVSANATDWTLLGMASNDPTGAPVLPDECPGSDLRQHMNTFTLSGCIQYVKIVDKTDPTPFSGSGDAFDVNAVCGEGPHNLDVPVDIKPTSCPNPLNVKSKGVLPVAILGTVDFDVSDIDPATVLLEGVPPLRWALEDVATPLGHEPVDCLD